MDLRDRLTAANLASERFRASDGYMSLGVNTNAEATERALAVVAAWLRDEATKDHIAAVAQQAFEDDAGPIEVGLCVLHALADSITGSTEGT